MMKNAIVLSAVLAATWSTSVEAQAVIVNTTSSAGAQTLLVDGGHVVGARAGTFAATSRGLVELRTEQPTFPLAGCIAGDGVDASLVGPPSRPHGVGARVVAVEGSAQTVVFADVPTSGGRYYDAAINSLQIVGSYVFVVASYSSGNCEGAHPDDGGSNFVLFDLERGHAIDLAHDPAVVAWTRLQRAHARAAFDRIETELQDAHAAPALVALVPVFDRLGRIALDAIYTMDSCYACTDADPESIGEWVRYASAAHVASRLPAFLRTVATPTNAARTAAASADRHVTGAGVVAPALASGIRSQFADAVSPPT
jgi:hypothetical protein